MDGEEPKQQEEKFEIRTHEIMLSTGKSISARFNLMKMMKSIQDTKFKSGKNFVTFPELGLTVDIDQVVAIVQIEPETITVKK